MCLRDNHNPDINSAVQYAPGWMTLCRFLLERLIFIQEIKILCVVYNISGMRDVIKLKRWGKVGFASKSPSNENSKNVK
jgi:hypothetical protein